jgi:hypothetical protein
MDTAAGTAGAPKGAPAGAPASAPAGAAGGTASAPAGRRLAGLLGIAALVCLLHAGLLLRSPYLLRGELPDPDDAMRLVRVTALLEGGGWYDDLVTRGNAPYGETLHWTRPQDALIAALTLPLWPLLGLADAVHLAGVIVSPLLHLVAVLAAGWVVRPLARKDLGALAALALLAQPLIVGVAAPGRADHHMLQMIVFLLGTGCLLRAAVDPGDLRMARAAGLLAALGVWVSVELLLLSLYALGVLALLWVLRGGARGAAARAFCAAHLLGLAAALVVERAPSDWGLVQASRLSVAHPVIGLVAWLGVAAVCVPGARRLLDGRARRAGAALLLGALGLVLLRVVLPALFRRPLFETDPVMWERWQDWIEEYKPLLVPRDLRGLGMFLKCLGPVLICLPFALRRLARERGRPAWPAWAAIVCGLLAFLPLSLYMVRFAYYAEILIAIVLAVVADALAERLETLQPRTLRLVVRPLAITALIPGFLFLGAVVEASAAAPSAGPARADPAPAGAAAAAPAPGTPGTPGATPAGVDEDAGRTLGGLAAVLADPAGLGGRPRTVLAFTQFSPDLMYRTPHSAVTSPYQFSAQGLKDGHAVFSARDDATALEVIRRRRVELLLLCPVGPERVVHGIRDGDGSLYDRLLHGEVPAWLRPVALPEELAAAFRLYEVLPGPAGG